MKKIIVISLCLILAGGMISLGFAMMCHGSSGKHTQMAQSEAATEAAPKAAQDAGNKICPVSGEKIDEKLKATYEYEGKVYNFCCPSCVDEFKKDPQKYIKRVDEELQGEAKEQAQHEEHGEEKAHESTTSHQETHGGHHH